MQRSTLHDPGPRALGLLTPLRCSLTPLGHPWLRRVLSQKHLAAGRPAGLCFGTQRLPGATNPGPRALGLLRLLC